MYYGPVTSPVGIMFKPRRETIKNLKVLVLVLPLVVVGSRAALTALCHSIVLLLLLVLMQTLYLRLIDDCTAPSVVILAQAISTWT
jgi:hypothetical protein